MRMIRAYNEDVAQRHMRPWGGVQDGIHGMCDATRNVIHLCPKGRLEIGPSRSVICATWMTAAYHEKNEYLAMGVSEKHKHSFCVYINGPNDGIGAVSIRSAYQRYCRDISRGPWEQGTVMPLHSGLGVSLLARPLRPLCSFHCLA